MYSPIMQVGSKLWFVGKIENHQTMMLTEDEVKQVCDLLNELKSKWRRIVEEEEL